MKFFLTIRYDHGDIYGQHELTPDQVRLLGFEGKYASYVRKSGDESICHAEYLEEDKRADAECALDEREQLIRRTWDRSPHRASVFALGFLRIPALTEADRRSHTHDEGSSPSNPRTVDTLEFTLERGTFNGRPSWAIVCEGVVVERGDL